MKLISLTRPSISKAIIVIALAFSTQLTCSAWGRLGHCTVQEIALRHLTPEAKAVIDSYGGLKPEDSFWMDIVSKDPKYKAALAGWHAAIATPDFKSPVEIREQYRKSRDGVTAMEYFREYLKDYRNLPDSVVIESIRCIVHIVGDFHCPAHVRYTDDINEGKFPVVFFGEEARLHDVWDSGLIQHESGLNWKQYSEYADRLDTWKKRQIRKTQKGWAREWFEDAAKDVRPVVGTVKSGDELGSEWAQDQISLAELELRKAGYQLAAALNEIFGK